MIINEKEFGDMWKYLEGDWVMSPSWAGLVDHHLRITGRLIDGNWERWYQVFDTTLTRGYADYSWLRAGEFENESRLVNRPDWACVAGTLQRTAYCQNVPYSIPNRTDCESLQRWIHTGLEQYRWNPQIWTLVATLVGGVAIAYFNTNEKPKRRKSRRTYRV
jgi:hypothetical protein